MSEFYDADEVAAAKAALGHAGNPLNCNLISAAPDLLKAASWARDILVQLKDAGHSVEIELTACERAIAKAEGRE